MSEKQNSKLWLSVVVLVVLGVAIAVFLRKQNNESVQTSPTETSAEVVSVETVYEKQCAQCHRADLGGNLGPNLIDDFWISGNTLEAMKNSIAVGNPERGMPAYKDTLTGEQIDMLVNYIAQNQGKQVESPKAPQGFGGKLETAQ